MFGSFQNFAYVSSYLHLKSFAWKRNRPVSAKRYEVDQGHCKNLL